LTSLDTDPRDTADGGLQRMAREHYIWPQLSRADVDAGVPVIFSTGQGVRVTTADGTEYVDLMSTVSRASTLGYGEERIVDAVADQLRRLHYGGTAGFQADVTIRLAAKLAELAPGDLKATFFVGSGSEANEAAIKLAHAYQRTRGGKPRAYKVISRWSAYHGAAGGAMAASDWLGVRRPFEPGYPGFSRVPAPWAYRCPFGLEPAASAAKCAEFLEQQILQEGPELVSAFIAEPIMQANGVQIPHRDYLRQVKDVCEQYGVLFIADEIITGFGRTGAWFAVNHWGIEPDIMTMAKALTAGYIPLGAAMVTGEIHDALDGFPDIHTYGGHPAGAIAALAAIEIYEEEGLIARAEEGGAALLESLEPLEELAIVGQVRGLGLWAAVDFTSDKATRALPDPDVLAGIVMRARELGVLVSQNGTCIEVAPPLVISPKDLHEAVGKFVQAVREADAAVA
jgi:adenosylmethionine-8-amino-7-oxononanoate aminotransferase